MKSSDSSIALTGAEISN